MVTGAEVATALIGALGLLGAGGGWVARRLEDDIEANQEAIDELDTGFARVTTRLFGHPDDDSDPGALRSRAQRMAQAEGQIDSLSDEVQYAKEQAEQNGQAIELLDEQVTEHTHQTRQALERIEEQLDENLIPPDEQGDFFQGGD